MNILIIDDHISVLKGLMVGVNFDAAGIDNVYTCTNVLQAKDIIRSKDIDILLSDIEMPGENGLDLNKWVFENYPSIIRILLTSHASFSYAQTSIKLSCFDYIIQPAPYYEIEAAIKKAVSKILSDRQKAHYYEMEVISNIVLNLFSKNALNKQQSIVSLNQMGYQLTEGSNVQSIIVDIYSYSDSSAATFSDSAIFISLLENANKCFMQPDIYSLICLNRYRQFVVLLFNNHNSLENIPPENFHTFYQGICREIDPEISCYVTVRGQIENIREVIYKGHKILTNNVAQKPGLYFSEKDIVIPEVTSFSENIARFSRLLESSQFLSLKENIYSFLDYNAALNRFNLDILCEFHQSITKLFFVFSYQHDIDIMNLFSSDYNYNDYMGCFKDVKSLKEGVSYLIDSISKVSNNDDWKGNVKSAVEYIQANISNDISVKDVADYVHFSPEYFSKLFKKEMGENVKNYILRIKVEAAKDLLANPNIPISVVASELGYNNFSHFTQMFRKQEHVTPSEYRRQILNQNKTNQLCKNDLIL